VEPSLRRHAIVNGQVYSGHPSVGELQIGYSGLCTATLIGQKTVLTAAHCIEGSASSHVFVAGGASYPAVAAYKHPNYAMDSSADIAVVILAQAPPISPSVISTAAPWVGLQVTLVGFGVTSEYGSDSGTKRIAKNTIKSVTQNVLTWSGASGSIGGTCYGDSGGPAFSTINGKEVQVGITSSGTPPCGNEDFDTRVDTFAAWVKQKANGDVASDTAPPPPPADTQAPQVAITAPTPGATVSRSITVRATVTDNVGVTQAQLFVDGQVAGSRTTAPFDFAATLAPGSHTLRVVGSDAAGNKGEAMVVVNTSNGTTSPPTAPDPTPSPGPTPAPGSFGATCAGPADCVSGLCAQDPAGGDRYCTQSCDDGSAVCPGGATCFPSTGSDHVCGPPADGQPTTPTAPGTPGSNPAAGATLLGSCAVAPSSAGLPDALPLMLLALLAARRRRAITSR